MRSAIERSRARGRRVFGGRIGCRSQSLSLFMKPQKSTQSVQIFAAKEHRDRREERTLGKKMEAETCRVRNAEPLGRNMEAEIYWRSATNSELEQEETEGTEILWE